MADDFAEYIVYNNKFAGKNKSASQNKSKMKRLNRIQAQQEQQFVDVPVVEEEVEVVTRKYRNAMLYEMEQREMENYKNLQREKCKSIALIQYGSTNFKSPTFFTYLMVHWQCSKPQGRRQWGAQ